MKDLINFPRELQKATRKLSHTVHMVWRDYELVHLFLLFMISASQSFTNTMKW